MELMFERKYGVADTVEFELFDYTTGDFYTGATFVAGDATIVIDGATEIAFDETQITEISAGTYEATISAALHSNKTLRLKIVDQGTKAFADKALGIETYGHPSAMHPFKNYDSGVLEGLTSGTPTTTSVPTNITAEASANTLHGRIACWLNAAGTYGQGRITANTPGANTTLTIDAVAVAPTATVRLIIL